MNRRSFISAAIAFAAAAVAGVPKVFGRRTPETTTCCAHEPESPAMAEYREARQALRDMKQHRLATEVETCCGTPGPHDQAFDVETLGTEIQPLPSDPAMNEDIDRLWRKELNAMIEREAKSYSEARTILLRAQADGLIRPGSWIDPTIFT